MHDAVEQFKAAMRSAGLEPPERIEPGRLHRFPGIDKGRGNDAGWCKLFDDERGGVFGDFSSDLGEHWQAEAERQYSAEDRESFRRRCEAERQKREAEERQQHETAVIKAAEILAAASNDPAKHPYSINKGVSLGPHVRRGAWPQRGWTDALIVPVFGTDGRVWTLEAINVDGDKDYLKDGRKRGGFYPFGKIRGAGRIFIGEGLATVAVVYTVEGSPAVAAMDTGNLPHVAQFVRELVPNADIVLLADNDVKPDGSNPGLKAAREAAALVGGRVSIPDLNGRKCDFWDVWHECGPEVLREQIEMATKNLNDPPVFANLRFTEEEIQAARATPTCIVDKYLYADVGVLAGPGGAGKTTMIVYEVVHIILGLPLWGLTVKKPGKVLIVTAEDWRETFAARLREVMAAMELSEQQRAAVFNGMAVWDVTGLSIKLTVVRENNIMLTGLADDIVDAYKGDPPVLVAFDPLISYGASEAFVNDNEQMLVTAGRRIVRGLGCCVRFIHHVGKSNAREKTLDQYTGRGGSALADGARMVAVLQTLDQDGEKGKMRPPPGCVVSVEAGITVLARAKLSYAPPNLPNIWIRRVGYYYEHFIETKPSKEDTKKAISDQLERFLASQIEQQRYHTRSTLESIRRDLDMTREQMRQAVMELELSRRVVDADLPKQLRKGGKKTFLCPTNLADRFGEVDEQSTEKTTEEDPTSPASTTSPPYRERNGGEVEPPFSPSVPTTSPQDIGEVRRGWQGSFPLQTDDDNTSEDDGGLDAEWWNKTEFGIGDTESDFVEIRL